MRASMVKIDPKKLNLELIKRGLAKSRVDAECGYSPGQMSRVLKRGTITGQQAATLKSLYNLDLSDYEEKEEEPKASDQISMDSQPIPAELQDAIYRAALTMVKAMTDDVDRVAAPLNRIAAALERLEKEGNGPAVLPWGEITNEDVGGEF